MSLRSIPSQFLKISISYTFVFFVQLKQKLYNDLPVTFLFRSKNNIIVAVSKSFLLHPSRFPRTFCPLWLRLTFERASSHRLCHIAAPVRRFAMSSLPPSLFTLSLSDQELRCVSLKFVSCHFFPTWYFFTIFPSILAINFDFLLNPLFKTFSSCHFYSFHAYN